MSKVSMSRLTCGLVFCSISSISMWAQSNACDINGDGTVNTSDIQAIVNMTIGISPCTVNIAGANTCNAIVVQRIINASMGQSCLTTTGLHVVSLAWTASTSSGITGYQISRGTVSGGPYTVIATVGSSAVTYTDTTVVSGQTYYYVVAALAGSSVSPNSSPIAAAIPTP